MRRITIFVRVPQENIESVKKCFSHQFPKCNLDVKAGDFSVWNDSSNKKTAKLLNDHAKETYDTMCFTDE